MGSKLVNDPEFSQAENLEARIREVLWPDPSVEAGHSGPCAHPEPDAVRSALRAIPECRKFAEIGKPVPENLEKVCQDLAARLAKAERTHPKEVGRLESLLCQPAPFEQVWAEELEEVGRLREARAEALGKHRAACRSPHGRHLTVTERAREARLCGLCFSGGGVRSATFNLGILQGMAKHGVLEEVDYLSTVSGGGYIGGWLAAWIKRKGFACVQRALCCEDQSPRGDQIEAIETEPISFLRDYSSYLTPQNGIFTADTWTAGTIWVRNTLLNLIVLLALLATLLLVPRLAAAVMKRAELWQNFDVIITALAIACQFTLIFNVVNNLKEFAHTDGRPCGEFGDSLPRVQSLIIFPSLLSAWFCASLLWKIAPEWPLSARHLLCIGTIVAVCFVLLVWLQYSCGYVGCYLRSTKGKLRDHIVAHGLCIVLPMITTAVKAAILWGIYNLFQHWAAHSSRDMSLRHITVWGIPLILADYSLCITIHIGLMGRYLLDDRREWWSRIAAYVGIYAVAIWALSSACFYGRFIENIPWTRAVWGAPLLLGVTLTCAGLIAVTSRRGAEFLKAPLFSLLVTATPYIFMIGLFVSVSWALDQVLSQIAGLPAFALWALAAVIAIVMAITVDVNEFSMHHFYRNRLIRTYLGASRTRRPHRLTGFDAADDLRLASLRPVPEPGLLQPEKPYTGPYPILNAALNLAHGDRLARQERKATSFIFTPRFCGYDYRPAREEADQTQTGNGDRLHGKPALRNAGYRPTSQYAYPDGGVHLGTAMAISGAATAPNAGRYTSTPLAFLLTVFNIRLGWWMGNPRNDDSWRRSGPHEGLVYFASELFGSATDRKRHVYLSDGGHFENLGIYELVRRRCSLIIACDAEEDAHSLFTGLGDAIRKCFIDFGVRICVNLDDLRPDPHTRLSKQHYVNGEIHYPDGATGTLIYIKASVTEDEPADLQAYRAKHPCFPHQSTAEQFFEESQFESYHRLGLHIGKDVFANWNRENYEWKGPLALPRGAHHRVSTFAAIAGDPRGR